MANVTSIIVIVYKFLPKGLYFDLSLKSSNNNPVHIFFFCSSAILYNKSVNVNASK